MSNPTPPVARQIPHIHTLHDVKRPDPYYWMRDREDPEVVAYLDAENAYARSVLAHTEPLQETLFEEMKGRIKKEDESVPYKLNGYWYYVRFEKGKEYPLYCRKQETLEGTEKIMLDVNQLAEGEAYCQVVGLTVSEDGRYLAYGIDTVGRRIYTLCVRDLETGKDLADRIEGVTGNQVWAGDHQTLFYTRQDPQTLRSAYLYRHQLGQAVESDALIFTEADDTFNLSIQKSKSRKFLFRASDSTMTSEIAYLESQNPTADFAVFLPRERGHEYGLDHFEDHFYIHTNWEAQNFRLMRTLLGKNEQEAWEEVIAHRPDVLLEGLDIFRDYLVLEERNAGLNQVRVIPWSDPSADYYLDFPEETYSAGIGFNPDFESHELRFGYESLTRPASTFSWNFDTRERKLLKQQAVLGDFDPENYQSSRVWATAQDGTRVPISLVWHKDSQGPAPLLLYGYGAYGISLDPWFSSHRLSLLDRGFIFAIAHLRGGEDLGRPWYEAGKLLHKRNTFTDFIACGEHLIAAGYTTQKQLIAYGGSAGGLLVGAVINMRPELFGAAFAAVPFVDVVTTMLDPDIPLTTGEYDEWGNPNDSDYFDYILSYSPYDNVKAQAYPPLLVTSGFHDSQVQYWEPTKWVARLRTMKTDQEVLLLDTNMDAGHGGASGRFQPLRERARDYAFFMDVMGMVPKE